MGKREREDEKEEYFPIFKKAKKTNVVGRVLQQLDSNVPKVTAAPRAVDTKSKKSEPTDASKPSSGFATVLSSLGIKFKLAVNTSIIGRKSRNI